MKHGLVVNPPCINQIRVLCQQRRRLRGILNDGIDELADECVRQLGHRCGRLYSGALIRNPAKRFVSG
jgi:hypothetical protein